MKIKDLHIHTDPPPIIEVNKAEREIENENLGDTCSLFPEHLVDLEPSAYYSEIHVLFHLPTRIPIACSSILYHQTYDEPTSP